MKPWSSYPSAVDNVEWEPFDDESKAYMPLDEACERLARYGFPEARQVLLAGLSLRTPFAFYRLVEVTDVP